MSDTSHADASLRDAEVIVDGLMRPLIEVAELLARSVDELRAQLELQRVEHERLVAELRDDLLETAGKVATLERLVMKPTEGRW